MVSETTPLTEIESRWVTGAAFLEQIDHQSGELAILFVPIERGPLPEANELIALNLCFEQRQAQFRIHARVLGVSDEPRGIRAQFLEKGRQAKVLACARGKVLQYIKRRYARIACMLHVRLTLPDGGEVYGTVTTIAEGGAGVLASVQGVAKEDRIAVEISFSESVVLRLGARVAAVVTGAEAGLALEFEFSSKQQRDALWEAVHQLRAGTSEQPAVP